MKEQCPLQPAWITLLNLLGRYWRRLVRTSPSDPHIAAPAGDAGLKALPAPAEFRPREGEVVHAHAPARGRDHARQLDLDTGTLLVTSRGIVYLTGEKRWRFPWRGVEQAGLEEGQRLQVETRSGRQFSFQLPSVAEGEELQQAALAAKAVHDRMAEH